MLLTITTTHRPATDLGYLLHKHPDRTQTFALSFGKAHVFYPEASEERCTATLLLDVNPVALVCSRDSLLTDYVNDRPYVASSFMSVAIARVYGSALGGRSKERSELVDVPLPLSATVAALPCRGDEGEVVLRRLFEPLEYAVSLQCADGADACAPSRYCKLHLAGRKPLAELLSHLYVLIPVLDNDKHYWVGDDEIDKLVRHGGSWLATHPQRDFIARRYLKHQRSLTSLAIARLSDGDQPSDDAEPQLEQPARLNDVRMAAVVHALRESGVTRVLDLGCGEGRLMQELLPHKQFSAIVGLDASVAALERAARRLKLDRDSESSEDRVKLLHGSLAYRDRRLAGFDAAAAVEVIEHLDPSRLGAFEKVVFRFARPTIVLVTTPNIEFNVKFSLPAGSFRHRDHRFEWTRAEFAAWAERTAGTYGYQVDFQGVGDADPECGPPTQMAVFQRCA